MHLIHSVGPWKLLFLVSSEREREGGREWRKQAIAKARSTVRRVSPA